MGLLVMDEAFDMWNKTKVKNGHGKYFAEWGDRDLRDMIRRDRNHPSVVLWSIGNEILEQGSPDGGQIAKHLSDICHQEDPTRPTTAGFNQFDGAIKNGLAAAVDVPAFNYSARRYPEVVRDHPDWPFFGSETASTVSTRGAYHLPIEKYNKHPSHEITSYDVIAPVLGLHPRLGVRDAGEGAAGHRRVRVDRLRLSRRADAVLRLGTDAGSRRLARPQLVLRDRRSRRLSEGSLLPLSERVDVGADGPRAAALELGGPREGSRSRCSSTATPTKSSSR